MAGLDGHEQHLVQRRVERQQALLELLRTKAPCRVPAAELASELSVATRTVERDVARLRAAGIPLDVRAGAGGGITFAATEEPRPVLLSPAEAGALLVALAATGPWASAAAIGARTKVLDALSPLPHEGDDADQGSS